MICRADDWPEHKLIRLAAITDPGAKGFSLGEGDWPFSGFIVHKGGQIYAYANVCPHRRHQLDLRPDDFLIEEGSFIRCASHGALFSPETGDCLVGPCVNQRLLTLPSRVNAAGWVVVRAPESLRDIELPG